MSLTRIDVVLRELRQGPAPNVVLAEALSTHSADVARLMCKLRDQGLTRNTSEPRKRAVYELTEFGKVLAGQRGDRA